MQRSGGQLHCLIGLTPHVRRHYSVRGEPRRAASLPTSKRLDAPPSRPTGPAHLSSLPVLIHRLQRPARSPAYAPPPYIDAFGGGGSAPDEGVDLGGLNLVHAAHGLRDLPLVRARVDDEDEGVVVCVRDRAGREITVQLMELPATAPLARVHTAANGRRSAAITRAASSAGGWERAPAAAGCGAVGGGAPSIFFMADSVVNGNFRIWYWSSLLTRGTERRRYLGLRSRRSVFGLWNFGLKYTLVDFFVLEPTARVLAAFFALSAGALALGAMVPAEERSQAQNGMERCLSGGRAWPR